MHHLKQCSLEGLCDICIAAPRGDKSGIVSVFGVDGWVQCGSHSMHQKRFSSFLVGLILLGGKVTGCDVFLWWHGC